MKTNFEKMTEMLNDLRANFKAVNVHTDENHEDYMEALRLFEKAETALESLTVFFAEGDRL